MTDRIGEMGEHRGVPMGILRGSFVVPLEERRTGQLSRKPRVQSQIAGGSLVIP